MKRSEWRVIHFIHHCLPDLGDLKIFAAKHLVWRKSDQGAVVMHVGCGLCLAVMASSPSKSKKAVRRQGYPSILMQRQAVGLDTVAVASFSNQLAQVRLTHKGCDAGTDDAVMIGSGREYCFARH